MKKNLPSFFNDLFPSYKDLRVPKKLEACNFDNFSKSYRIKQSQRRMR